MKRFFAFAVVVILTGSAYLKLPGPVSKEKEPVAQPRPEVFIFTYKIRSGDSVSLIAHRFGVSPETIMNANVIKDGIIYKGDILGIPLKRSQVAEFHKVREGETVSLLARTYGTSVGGIMKINRMKDDTLPASRKVLVRRGGGPDSRFVVFKVGYGDLPHEISRAFGVSIKDIKSLNIPGPNWLEPGSHIVVDTLMYGYARRTQEEIIETASAYLGSPYKYGGNSTETGIDCSAYVKKVFSFFGVNLPRTVRMMHRHAKGRWVEKNSLEKGDLVFFETDRPFPSHIGIYIGEGNFIHASSVQGKVVVSNLGEPYYTKTYIGAKRVYIGSEKAVASRDF